MYNFCTLLLYFESDPERSITEISSCFGEDGVNFFGGRLIRRSLSTTSSSDVFPQ